jgi:Zn ribbon nucleic-acid-binding protein
MADKDYCRMIGLRCPTCSSTEFLGATEGSNSTEILTCAACGRSIVRGDLVDENRENIDEHVSEMCREAVDDLAKELRKRLQNSLRSSKNIQIK